MMIGIKKAMTPPLHPNPHKAPREITTTTKSTECYGTKKEIINLGDIIYGFKNYFSLLGLP